MGQNIKTKHSLTQDPSFCTEAIGRNKPEDEFLRVKTVTFSYVPKENEPAIYTLPVAVFSPRG